MRNAGMGHIFLQANEGKRSIVVDLKKPDGLEVVQRLAGKSDVLITNVRPKALQRLGLDDASVRARNPRIIHVSCCGFDPEGPYADRPAYDDLIQGATGMPWLMQQAGGAGPAYAPITLSDRVTGLHAVYAVTAALYARQVSGLGQAVVVPMFEAMTQFILGDHLAGLSFVPPEGEPGYARLLTPHRKPYRTSDGWLCVLIYNDKQWRSFFAASGEPDRLERDARFATHGARASNIDAVYEEVGRIMQSRTTAQWRALLDGADIPNMPMNSPADLLADPQHAATGFVRTVQHPSEGELRATRQPTRWSETPLPADPSPAPRLGEDTVPVLRELGYSAQAIDHLLQTGACRQHPPTRETP
jgi:crotonobetainyl-CoA:carnitine CoA-transferase CaiB-like acyl-CoA transferase